MTQFGNRYENPDLNSWIPFSQTMFRKISGDASCFKRLSVSRATHLPATLAASGFRFWETPELLP